MTLPFPARLLCAAVLSFGLLGSAVPAVALTSTPSPTPSATATPVEAPAPAATDEAKLPTPEAPEAEPITPDAEPTESVSDPEPDAAATQDEITSFVPDLNWNPLSDPDSNARYGEHYAEPVTPLKVDSPLSTEDGGGMAAIAPRTGAFKVTLVTVQLSGKTVADTNAINMTAARNSITAANAFWKSTSAGRLSISQVKELRHTSAAKITDSYGTIMATVTKELNWQYRPYESLVIFVPHADLNYNGSWGILGGGFTDGPTTGRVIMPYPSAVSNNVVTHEFGHVLGLHHANSLACTSGRVDVPRSGASWSDPACYSAEYSDTTDLMGYAQVSSPNINAFLWEYGGFGTGSEIQNLGELADSRQVTLRPWGGTASNRAVKFTDPLSGEVYYLELRAPVGHDTATAVNGNRGVKITKKDILGWSGNASIVLTPNSRISGWGNNFLTWQAGQTFKTHSGTQVKITSVSNTEARITIEPLQTSSVAMSAITAAAARTPTLGTATSGIVCGMVNGGCYQSYKGGAVIWSSATGAHATKGAIRAAWATTDYERGRLGYPVRDEECGLANGGCYQRYQGGDIHWTPATGAHPTNGAIRTAWAATGYENGRLGYPTGSEICGLYNGGCYQTYQRGTIYWSAATGAHPTKGGIRTAWAITGHEKGRLGYPTGAEVCGLVNGGCYQRFQGGDIHWSPATGAHPTNGAIRRAWGATGYEKGRLGYPTRSEVCTTTTSCKQTYQGGTITWTPATGARPSYK